MSHGGFIHLFILVLFTKAQPEDEENEAEEEDEAEEAEEFQI
jgi:hypothetical protein